MNLSQAGDVRVGLRHRLWQKDTASVDTERFGLSGGLRLPTGATAFSTDQVAPFFGASWMKISERQGLDLAAVWREGHGWLWTGKDLYRHLYRHSDQTWIYFLARKNGQPHFYNYANKQVE